LGLLPKRISTTASKFTLDIRAGFMPDIHKDPPFKYKMKKADAFYESLGFRKHGYSFLMELE
jgi:hypothetical protein